MHAGLGLRQRGLREGVGQLLRVVGGATTTAPGWVPHGNTGGHVSPFKRMAIVPDLAQRIAEAYKHQA